MADGLHDIAARPSTIGDRHNDKALSVCPTAFAEQPVGMSPSQRNSLAATPGGRQPPSAARKTSHAQLNTSRMRSPPRQARDHTSRTTSRTRSPVRHASDPVQSHWFSGRGKRIRPGYALSHAARSRQASPGKKSPASLSTRTRNGGMKKALSFKAAGARVPVQAMIESAGQTVFRSSRKRNASRPETKRAQPGMARQLSQGTAPRTTPRWANRCHCPAHAGLRARHRPA